MSKKKRRYHWVTDGIDFWKVRFGPIGNYPKLPIYGDCKTCGLTILNKNLIPYCCYRCNPEFPRPKFRKKIRFKKKSREKIRFAIDSNITERIIHRFLNVLNLKFEPHKYLHITRYHYRTPDFILYDQFLKSILIVEVDGCYWHGCSKCFPELIDRRIDDLKKDRIILKIGIGVVRILEHEVRRYNYVYILRDRLTYLLTQNYPYWRIL